MSAEDFRATTRGALVDNERDLLEENLRQTHGEVFSAEFIDVGGAKVRVYYRCPTIAENDAFKNKAFDDKSPRRQAEGADELGRRVVVHPDREAFSELVKRRPMIPSVIAGEAALVASGKESELGKRL